jgi:hypothetical protein
MRSRKKSKDAGEIKIKWVHEPDPVAEEEFWKLWLQLALEQMLKQGGRKGGGGHEKT